MTGWRETKALPTVSILKVLKHYSGAHMNTDAGFAFCKFILFILEINRSLPTALFFYTKLKRLQLFKLDKSSGHLPKFCSVFLSQYCHFVFLENCFPAELQWRDSNTRREFLWTENTLEDIHLIYLIQTARSFCQKPHISLRWTFKYIFAQNEDCISSPITYTENTLGRDL